MNIVVVVVVIKWRIFGSSFYWREKYIKLDQFNRLGPELTRANF